MKPRNPGPFGAEPGGACGHGVQTLSECVCHSAPECRLVIVRCVAREGCEVAVVLPCVPLSGRARRHEKRVAAEVCE
eukprot:3301396-Pleurochrysis_carterae.AAC.1